MTCRVQRYWCCPSLQYRRPFFGRPKHKAGEKRKTHATGKTPSPCRASLALLARFTLGFTRLKKREKIIPTFCRVAWSKHLSQLSSLTFTQAMKTWLKDQMLLSRIDPLRICANTKLITNLFHLSYVDSKVSKMLSKIGIFYHVIFTIRKYICKKKHTRSAGTFSKNWTQRILWALHFPFTKVLCTKMLEDVSLKMKKKELSFILCELHVQQTFIMW